MTGEPTEPVAPAFGGGSLADVMPQILGLVGDDAAGITAHTGPPEAPLFHESLAEARAVVLVTFDGMGLRQLTRYARSCPTMAEMSCAAITSVAPSTTAAALTSLSTGAPPGVHGIVGYRIATGHGNLNVLRWSTPNGPATKLIPPEEFQPLTPFAAQHPPVVSSGDYAASGFTRAHLRNARYVPIAKPSNLVVETRRLVAAGEPFVYAYYDGPDAVGHRYGLGEHYETELAWCDRIVGDLIEALPRGTAVVVTSDHGLVDCGTQTTNVHLSVTAHCAAESGEHRFRWLHAKPGHAGHLLEAAVAAHGEQAWVVTRDEMIDAGWFGPSVSDAARGRLGDVALVARDHHAFTFRSANGAAPTHAAPANTMLGRHGSLTAEEMLVPLLTWAP